VSSPNRSRPRQWCRPQPHQLPRLCRLPTARRRPRRLLRRHRFSAPRVFLRYDLL